jgi:hypothetical protein
MRDDRLRIQVDPTYVSALGLATYAFALLEWNAVWCCERTSPGIIGSLPDRTAGSIAKKLIRLATRSTIGTNDLLPLALDFQGMVSLRNDLLHAKPGSDSDGAQRLFRNGQPWSIEAINDAADAFVACSLRFNALLDP